jgi:hypothetical protein
MARISSERARRKNRLSLRKYYSKLPLVRFDGRIKENTSQGHPHPQQISLYLNLPAVVSFKCKSTNFIADPPTRFIGVTNRPLL